jgi:hypothetical protein
MAGFGGAVAENVSDERACQTMLHPAGRSRVQSAAPSAGCDERDLPASSKEEWLAGSPTG